MGLSWNDIEVKKRGLGNKLLESVSRNVSNFNPQDISMSETEKDSHMNILNNLLHEQALMHVNNRFKIIHVPAQLKSQITTLRTC